MKKLKNFRISLRLTCRFKIVVVIASILILLHNLITTDINNFKNFSLSLTAVLLIISCFLDKYGNYKAAKIISKMLESLSIVVVFVIPDLSSFSWIDLNEALHKHIFLIIFLILITVAELLELFGVFTYEEKDI